jgi:hypothetical protein
MAYDLPFLDHHAQRRLNRQVSSLARDAGHITDLLSRFTANMRRDADHYAHDAGHYAQDFADEAWHQGAAAAKVLGKQALRAGKAVSKDPVPAVIAVAGLACLLSLVMSSGRAARRRQ